MKINLPVTGTERIFPSDWTLVSKTDTKGVITFANDNFVEVCGFTRGELVGTSHNIIRHPDVPPVIFEIMWNTLKQGFPWHGVVKNRCKNGDHYWVDARVVPIKKAGEIIGYMSVRTCPTREAIAAAEQAYKDAVNSKTAIRASTGTGWKRIFSIKNGVSIGMVFVTLLMIAGGILGVSGLNMSSNAMRDLYQDDMDPVQAIGRINFLMADNRAQVALALHHNPDTKRSELVDHDLAVHLRTLERNKAEIDTLWDGYFKRIHNPAEQTLADTYWKARNRYVYEGLFQARQTLVAGDYKMAEIILNESVNPLYDEANRKVGQLLKHLTERAQVNYLEISRRNETISVIAISGIALGVAIMLLSGAYFFRATIVPLQTAVKSLENIAEGNLSETVAASAYGESGRVMAAVTVMQMHLKVMMDEIRQSSDSVRQQCRHLNQTMMNLAEHSEEQHDRVYQTLDGVDAAGASLNALAGEAENLMAELAAVSAGDGVAERSEQLAGAARLQAMTIEDVAAQLRKVAALIVENREEVQGAWAASQQLEKTAGELDKMVKFFE